ncbi:MAG: LysR family transcriptional regulator [Adlercreutzia sp.]|nr:LysR family transcriptional regulator [Adlercreutzia sp.]
MELKHLEEFLLLAQVNNFHRAAEELFITQPTLSNHIRSLENELGFELIDRSNGNGLTQAGAIFYWDATKAIDILNDSIEQCARVANSEIDEKRDVLKIVANPLYDYRQQLQEQVAKMNPALSAEFIDYDLKRPVLAPLINGEVDLIAIYDVPEIRKEAARHGLLCQKHGVEHFAVFFSKENPIALHELTRGSVASATIAEHKQFALGPWKTAICDMLGPETTLCILDDTPNNETWEGDIDNHLVVGTIPSTVALCKRNPMLAYQTTIDGQPITHSMMLVYDPQTATESLENLIQDFCRS